MGIRRFSLALVASVLAACTASGDTNAATISRVVARPQAAAPGTATPVATPRQTAKPQVTPRETPARSPRSTAFARVGGVRLLHPADHVLRVGFHQASDPANRSMTVAKTAVCALDLPSRGRSTSRRSAADIVVDPRAEIFAPVSGVVKRAGDYRLYCKHQDAFVVISPDGHPEIEVKILHVSGRRVRAGDRVVAGTTLIAKRPTTFPFSSQIDAFVSGAARPHVHIEVTQIAVPSAVPQVGQGLAFGC
jgi:hypothetical protein